MSELRNTAPCGLKLGGGLVSDGEKIYYLPWGNDLKTMQPDYERCLSLINRACFPIIVYEETGLYCVCTYNENVIFIGLDIDSPEQLAIYGLNKENIVTKISSIGGGGSVSQSIEYISVDNLTSDNPSVTIDGLSQTIQDCYNKGVLPCIVDGKRYLFYPVQWLGDLSMGSVAVYDFYNIANNNLNRITVERDECTYYKTSFYEPK